MKKIIIGIIILAQSLGFISNFVFAAEDSECGKGIKLNTDVPFIGKCISTDSNSGGGGTSVDNAFPKLIGGISKIVITFILVASLLMIIMGGVLIASGGINSGNVNKGKQLILKVVIGLALLGLSGMILHLINPNFFKI